MNKISFSKEAIEAMTKDEFVSYCAVHHSELSATDVAAYYNEVVPAPAKVEKKEPAKAEKAKP